MADTLSKPHLPYVDCLRGYAVLMVIAGHLTFEYPDLPYPVHRLTTMGWYGVQLFFLASCFTLMLSWHAEVGRRGSADVVAFFIRRFFRIAPAYYAAALFYYFIAPPQDRFNVAALATTLTFINAWHPVWTSTLEAGWSVVPGGWSISVEFTFYLLFPLFVTWVTNLRRAMLVFLISVVVGILADRMAFAALHGSYRPQEVSNFLFFWFPNQMSVFALGGVVFFLLRRTGTRREWRDALERGSTLIATGGILIFAALAYVPLGHYLGDRPYVPSSLAVSLPLMAFMIALSFHRGPLVNRYAAAMGKVSFSAYLLHFAVLQLIELLPATFHTGATGLGAVFAFAGGWAAAVAMVYAGSWLSYQLIEQPMMAAGKAIIRARRAYSPTVSG